MHPFRSMSKGFTLVEVMISLFVLSIISVAALSSFQQLIRAKEVQKSHEVVLTSLSFAYTTILNDITQQIDIETPLIMTERDISFSRALPGGENQLDIATVHYTWQSNALLRELNQGESATTQTLLNNVKSIEWQWWADEGWNNVSVPVPVNKEVRAIKLSFIDQTVGEVSWIFVRP